MAYCCSHCDFTSQFQSALLMHQQLYHENSDTNPQLDIPKKCNTVPRVSPPRSPFSEHMNKGFRLAGRTSSATRLFDKLKARICRSRNLFSHPEENRECPFNVRELSVPSECTSKALKVDTLGLACVEDAREGFGCHLCPFDADRITVLDRHLLNYHKIGLENLLKLVMAKTKDGLAEDNTHTFGDRQPYYRIRDEIFQEGEFIIETVAPKIKILKHASTNTDDIDLTVNNCKSFASEIENLMKGKEGGKDFMSKMVTLDECMCKFVASSNTLKKVVAKELDSKVSLRETSANETLYNLGLGKGDKEKMSPESYYF